MDKMKYFFHSEICIMNISFQVMSYINLDDIRWFEPKKSVLTERNLLGYCDLFAALYLSIFLTQTSQGNQITIDFKIDLC